MPSSKLIGTSNSSGDFSFWCVYSVYIPQLSMGYPMDGCLASITPSIHRWSCWAKETTSTTRPSTGSWSDACAPYLSTRMARLMHLHQPLHVLFLLQRTGNIFFWGSWWFQPDGMQPYMPIYFLRLNQHFLMRRLHVWKHRFTLACVFAFGSTPPVDKDRIQCHTMCHRNSSPNPCHHPAEKRR